MNTYTYTGFTGHWPVGTAAVVVAKTKFAAAERLNAKLRSQGLPGDAEPDKFELLDTSIGSCRILLNGDY